MSDHIPMEQLYSVRLLILMEESPQADSYRQVILDGRQFKEFSDLMGKFFHSKEVTKQAKLVSKGSGDGAMFVLGDKIIKLPDLKEIQGNYLQ